MARPRLQGETFMLALAVGVGLATGLLAALLIYVVGLVQGVAFGGSVSWPTLLAVPVVGALVVGILVTYIVPESVGGGVVEVIARISTHGGRLRRRVPFLAVLASGIALGTGGAGGREGPIVLIGGSVGSLFGRVFAVDGDRMRTLVAAGVAAGIGASFNAPIGGMLFAIELILGAFRRSVLQSVVVASVVSSVTARQIIGPDVIYEPDTLYTLNDARALGLCAVLGCAAALFGLGFLHGEDLARRTFARMTIWPPLKLAIGGLGVGLIALVVPEVIGTGDDLPPIDGLRDPIHAMLDGQVHGDMAAGFLLLLAVAKLVATCLSVGSGNAVGTFAPALFCGAALGGVVGHVAEVFLPAAGLQPGAFAVVGMAAVFAAAARMPLTAIVIAVELTNGYELVLPLMLAAGLATFVAGRLHPESVYTLPLRQRGMVYTESDHAAITQVVCVGDIMTTDPETLAADLSVERARDEFRRRRRSGLPVLDDAGRFAGVVTPDDLSRAGAPFAGDGGPARPLTVADVCMRRPPTVTPDDSLVHAVCQMATTDIGRLPVVSVDDGRRLVGVVRRSDLMKAYHQVVAPLTALHRKVQHVHGISDLRVVELRIRAGAPTAGRRVRDVSWPGCAILAYVRRGIRGIVPDGGTELRQDDTVTVLTSGSRIREIRHLFGDLPQAGHERPEPDAAQSTA